METIIAALIAGLCSGGSAIVVSRISNDKMLAVLEERIENLRREVQKHNGVVERTYQLETDVALLKQSVDDLKAA